MHFFVFYFKNERISYNIPTFMSTNKISIISYNKRLYNLHRLSLIRKLGMLRLVTFQELLNNNNRAELPE